MKGMDVIAQVLKAEGVEFIGCYPRNPLIEACAKVGIRPIVCRQERMGIAIVDGFTRTTNGQRIGVFVCQHGPGIENAFAGVAQAFSDNVPILMIPGGEANARQGIRPTFNACDNFAHITKWRTFVRQPKDLIPALRHSFYRLRTGAGGPVLIETSQDALFGKFEGDFDYTPVQGSRYSADTSLVNEALDMLLAAELPVIHAGQGVLFAQACAELVALAEWLDIPVITTMPGKSSFPENHPLSVGASAITKPENVLETYAEADCIFAIGSSLTQTIYGTSAPHGKKLIQATLGEEDVHKEYAVDVALLGDAKLLLQAMLSEMRARGVDKREGRRAETNQSRKQVLIEKWMPEFTSSEEPINQYRIIWDMRQHLDADKVIMTHDAGTPREQIISFWETPNPRGYLGWGKSTQLGFGLGAIMGAKLAEPEKICINIMGDAAIGMVGMDLETAVRNKIGITTLIFNNGIMAIESDSLIDAHTEYGANYVGGNYAEMAQSFGAFARLVTDPDKFIQTLDEAIAANEAGQPAVIEIVVKAGYIWPGREPHAPGEG